MSDPYGDKVVLLLHGDGTNGSTSITDSSGIPKAVTAGGNAQISTAQSKFGGASIAFDGAGDYLSLGTPSTYTYLDIGSVDFTVEFWVYTNGTSTYAVLGNLVNSSGSGHFWLTLNSTYTGLHTVGFAAAGTNYKFGTSALTTGAWTHIELSRSGTSLYCFVDGVQLGTTQTLNNFTGTLTNDMRIGTTTDGAMSLNGYIDDLRLTSGVARHIADFTPPTAALPDPTSLLNYRGYLSLLGVVGYAPSEALDATGVRNVGRAQNLGLRDIYYGGTGRITGTVKEKANPNNLPLHRKVLLLDEATRAVVRETWSDATTGAYTFNNVAMQATYTVMTFDYLHNYRAVIADNLTPEIMP